MVNPTNTQDKLHTQEALVIFTPSGKRGRVPISTNLLQAARNLGVDIDSVCGGRAICGRCQVRPMVGDFAKHGIQSSQEHLSPFSNIEKGYESLRSGCRLSCQVAVLGDMVIDVPVESQVHRQVVRKGIDQHHITLDPIIRLCHLEVQPPDMKDSSSDLQRLSDALEFEWGLSIQQVDLHVIQNLQNALRQGAWRVTVAVYQEATLIAIWPGLKEDIYGIAIDIGSTTIAAHLCHLCTSKTLASSGLMNPQIRFGEDLMSRVSYAMMNANGTKEMTVALHQALQSLIDQTVEKSGIDPSEVLDITLVGNPVMHHLLLGINPVELGGAPFALAKSGGTTLKASELHLSLNPGTRVYVLPCIAGHVGADAAAVVLAEQPQQFQEATLLVDVGTNAEIVLAMGDRLLACSSPTGPAFEGAQISGGQRAAPGAIERVRIDKETLEPYFKVIGCELWSNEEGFQPTLKKEGIEITGICGSGIIELIAECYLAGIITSDGTIDGKLKCKTPRIQPHDRTYSYELLAKSTRCSAILLTQNDIRSIQLAKAALYAGIALLMQKMQITQVSRIRLAGAFGSHIDVKYAMVLGMIPDCSLDKVTSAGNAASTGARIALLNKASRTVIEHTVKNIEKIETAIEPQFQELFVGAMAIPHAHAPFHHLRKSVTLPSTSRVSTITKNKGRRRVRHTNNPTTTN
jgi:uncharacterized 2Fe-2S/4Fe-4S cluster protein (DUF4445 family)